MPKPILLDLDKQNTTKLPTAPVMETQHVTSAYQTNLQQPVQQKWYAGDKPTTQEVLGRIASIYEVLSAA